MDWLQGLLLMLGLGHIGFAGWYCARRWYALSLCQLLGGVSVFFSSFTFYAPLLWGGILVLVFGWGMAYYQHFEAGGRQRCEGN